MVLDLEEVGVRDEVPCSGTVPETGCFDFGLLVEAASGTETLETRFLVFGVATFSAGKEC